VASTAARISEINRLTWEDVRGDIDWQKERRHLPLDPENKGCKADFLLLTGDRAGETGPAVCLPGQDKK
jgi:hypothetical protein